MVVQVIQKVFTSRIKMSILIMDMHWFLNRNKASKWLWSNKLYNVKWVVMSSILVDSILYPLNQARISTVADVANGHRNGDGPHHHMSASCTNIVYIILWFIRNEKELKSNGDMPLTIDIRSTGPHILHLLRAPHNLNPVLHSTTASHVFILKN